MRVLGISGSLRRDSHNSALLRAAGELIEEHGAEFEVYDGLKAIPPYDEDDDVGEERDAMGLGKQRRHQREGVEEVVLVGMVLYADELQTALVGDLHELVAAVHRVRVGDDRDPDVRHQPWDSPSSTSGATPDI